MFLPLFLQHTILFSTLASCIKKDPKKIKCNRKLAKSFLSLFFAARQPQIIGSSGSCYAPPNSIRSQKGYDEIILTGGGTSSKISSGGAPPMLAKKSIMKKPPVPLPSNTTSAAITPAAPPVVNQSECQYAQLIFDKNHRHFAADDSVLYLNTNSSRYIKFFYLYLEYILEYSEYFQSKVPDNLCYHWS